MDDEKVNVNEELPFGKVRTVSGEIIDRAGAMFFLSRNEFDKTRLRSSDGTEYKEGENGVIRRIDKVKVSKAEKKALKRKRKNWLGDQKKNHLHPFSDSKVEP